MGGGKTGKSDTVSTVGQDGAWPPWAPGWSRRPCCFMARRYWPVRWRRRRRRALERAVADVFAPYHQVVDQGYAYRYYAPEPGPTPVVTASIHYADGRPEETVRLPARGTLPRLRYQRQLALANHLMSDFDGGPADHRRREPEPLRAIVRPAPCAVARWAAHR